MQDNRDSIDRAMQEKRALEAYFTQAIQDAAGDSVITRNPITGPDWPNRSDYPNRQQFRAACAEWRRNTNDR